MFHAVRLRKARPIIRLGQEDKVKPARNSGGDAPACFIDELLDVGERAVMTVIIEEQPLIKPDSSNDKGAGACQALRAPKTNTLCDYFHNLVSLPCVCLSLVSCDQYIVGETFPFSEQARERVTNKLVAT